MRRSKKKQKTEILVWRYSLQEKILQYITLDGRSLDLDIHLFFFHLFVQNSQSDLPPFRHSDSYVERPQNRTRDGRI